MYMYGPCRRPRRTNRMNPAKTLAHASFFFLRVTPCGQCIHFKASELHPCMANWPDGQAPSRTRLPGGGATTCSSLPASPGPHFLTGHCSLQDRRRDCRQSPLCWALGVPALRSAHPGRGGDAALSLLKRRQEREEGSARARLEGDQKNAGSKTRDCSRVQGRVSVARFCPACPDPWQLPSPTSIASFHALGVVLGAGGGVVLAGAARRATSPFWCIRGLAPPRCRPSLAPHTAPALAAVARMASYSSSIASHALCDGPEPSPARPGLASPESSDDSSSCSSGSPPSSPPADFARSRRSSSDMALAALAAGAGAGVRNRARYFEQLSSASAPTPNSPPPAVSPPAAAEPSAVPRTPRHGDAAKSPFAAGSTHPLQPLQTPQPTSGQAPQERDQRSAFLRWQLSQAQQEHQQRLLLQQHQQQQQQQQQCFGGGPSSSQDAPTADTVSLEMSTMTLRSSGAEQASTSGNVRTMVSRFSRQSSGVSGRSVESAFEDLVAHISALISSDSGDGTRSSAADAQLAAAQAVLDKLSHLQVATEGLCRKVRRSAPRCGVGRVQGRGGGEGGLKGRGLGWGRCANWARDSMDFRDAPGAGGAGGRGLGGPWHLLHRHLQVCTKQHAAQRRVPAGCRTSTLERLPRAVAAPACTRTICPRS